MSLKSYVLENIKIKFEQILNLSNKMAQLNFLEKAVTRWF